MVRTPHAFFAAVALTWVVAFAAADEHRGIVSTSKPAPLTDAIPPRRRNADYINLPIRFEPNVGQAPSQIEYLARGTHYAVAITERGAILSLRQDSIPPTSAAATARSLRSVPCQAAAALKPMRSPWMGPATPTSPGIRRPTTSPPQIRSRTPTNPGLPHLSPSSIQLEPPSSIRLILGGVRSTSRMPSRSTATAMRTWQDEQPRSTFPRPARFRARFKAKSLRSSPNSTQVETHSYTRPIGAAVRARPFLAAAVPAPAIP